MPRSLQVHIMPPRQGKTSGSAAASGGRASRQSSTASKAVVPVVVDERVPSDADIESAKVRPVWSTMDKWQASVLGGKHLAVFIVPTIRWVGIGTNDHRSRRNFSCRLIHVFALNV